MKSLVIAEKPSVARDIARVLHCSQKGNGTLEGKDYVVTWALGHLVTLADPEKYVSPVLQLLSGGLMLGAVFMATDYVTSPMSKKGMLIYGVCIGLLTVVIRLFGAYPEGMSFAILIMNAFTPLINTYCKPKRFGEVAKKK